MGGWKWLMVGGVVGAAFPLRGEDSWVLGVVLKATSEYDDSAERSYQELVITIPWWDADKAHNKDQGWTTDSTQNIKLSERSGEDQQTHLIR